MVWRSLSHIAFSDVNNYWLVAKGNLEKKIKSSTEKYRTPTKLRNEMKKNDLSIKKCLFLRKLTKIFKLILCFSEFVKLLFLSSWDRWLFYLRTEKGCSSEAVSFLTALERRKRKEYRKQTISHVSLFLNKVSALEHDRLMQASLCTVSLLFANTLA